MTISRPLPAPWSGRLTLPGTKHLHFRITGRAINGDFISEWVRPGETGMLSYVSVGLPGEFMWL